MEKKNQTITDDENGCVKNGSHKVWVYVHHEDFKYQSITGYFELFNIGFPCGEF